VTRHETQPRIKLTDLALGLAIITFAGSTGVALAQIFYNQTFVILTMGLSLVVGNGLETFGFLGAAIVVASVGIAKKRNFLLLSVPVFFVGWFALSVMARLHIENTVTAMVPTRESVAQLAKFSILILDQDHARPEYTTIPHVMKVIKIWSKTGYKHKQGAITEITLAKHAECTPEELEASYILASSGRPDECFKEREIATIPDGLALKFVSKYEDNHISCCDKVIAAEMKLGKEIALQEWQQSIRTIPAYGPFPAWFQPATGTWDYSGGPFQNIKIGAQHIQVEDIVGDIFGVEVSILPPVPKLSISEQLKFGKKLSKSWTWSQSIASYKMLANLNADELVTNEEALQIASHGTMFSVGARRTGKFDEVSFRKALETSSVKSKTIFTEAVLGVLSSKQICTGCQPEIQLYKKLFTGQQRQRAIAQFEDISDLEAWQYFALVQIAVPTAFEDQNWSANSRSALFAKAVKSTGAALDNRIQGFVSGTDHMLKGDELDSLATLLSSLSDTSIIQVSGNIYPYRYYKDGVMTSAVSTKSWEEFWRAVIIRIETSPSLSREPSYLKKAKYKLEPH
jgi:hypothetical protein